MSIVLDALEKIQRQKNKSAQNDNKISRTTGTVSFEKQQSKDLLVLSIDNPTSKTENIYTQKNKTQIPTPATKSLQNKRLFILTIILFITTGVFILSNLYLKRDTFTNHPKKSIVIPFTSEEAPIPSQSKLSAIKNILLDNTQPQLKVTGVVWDEKDPIVLVNGKLLKQGDEILGAKVVKIEPTKATFLYDNNEFTISVE